MVAATVAWILPALLGTFTVGALLGNYVLHDIPGHTDVPEAPDDRADVIDQFLEKVSAENIGVYLRNLTLVPHLAGTEQGSQTARQIQRHFEDSGFDTSVIYEYDVLLSYPDNENPNRVVVLDEQGGEVSVSQPRQTPLGSEEENSDLVTVPFNGHSGTGTVEGDPIYAHYGAPDDFNYLDTNGISVDGKIVLARYGRTFRGNIVHQAETRGAAGVIIFSDPEDYAPNGPEDVYPDDIFLPDGGVQSGSLLITNGDPLTPHYPSTDDAYRIPEENSTVPKIPVQPIGYHDAEQILRYMSTQNPPPEGWAGGLNVSYSIGPGFQNPDWKLRLEVRTANTRATISNVIATITGSVEPDRYVLLGNHRDAWIFGAVDPTSGTAALYEIARVLGELKNSGWRPRRTIVLCSWDAEEYGLIGSTEWTEQFKKLLDARGVAYLNVDSSVSGNYTLDPSANPLLYQVLYEAAKRVPNPNPDEVNNGRSTVYDTWLYARPSSYDPAMPSVGVLGSGSDYGGFQHNIGIPSVDISYTHDNRTESYPLYHTLYDTFLFLDQLIDRGFYSHKAIAQVWGTMALMLSEPDLLPFNVRDYGEFVQRAFQSISESLGPKLATQNITLDGFQSAVEDFASAANQLQDIIDNLDTTDPLEIRQINDRLTTVDRAFIIPWGLPNKDTYNHVVFAPSSNDRYSGQSFSGLGDLLYNIDSLPEPQQTERWNQVRSHLAEIIFYVRSAAAILRNDV